MYDFEPPGSQISTFGDVDIDKIKPFYPSSQEIDKPYGIYYENYKFSAYSMLFHSNGEARQKLEDEMNHREYLA